MSWQQNLKVGDMVVVLCSVASDYVAKVDRLTATQIVVGKLKFSRTHGRIVGANGGGYHVPLLMEPNAETIERITKERIVQKLRHVKWPEFNMDTLEKVLVVLREGATL